MTAWFLLIVSATILELILDGILSLADAIEQKLNK